MGGFGFTEAQEMLRQEVRRFAQKELAPGALERCKMGPMELYEALAEIDKKIVDMGWTALNVPAKYGGQQIDAVSLGIIFEESAKVDPYVETVGAMQATSALLETLPEEVQDEWFPPLIKRERRHAFGFTEAAAGSDAASIATKAVRDGDDYIISGEKFPIPFAMIADAASISVKTDPTAGFKGISMFWVPLNLPGITRSHLPWMGNPNLVPSVAAFDEVRVPAKYREGEEGKGFYMVMNTLDWLRVITAFTCLCRAQASLEEAIAWSKERIAFGQPISRYQGVSFLIAEHYTRIEAARLLCYRVLWLKDQGAPYITECSMAKWYSVEVSIQAIKDCMVIIGHPAYSTEHPISQRLRDVIGFQMGDGTPQMQKLIISRMVLGK
ncbi:MAG: acyl-CoA dehydrogenase family protein [Dehalococcoidia bacterium]